MSAMEKLDAEIVRQTMRGYAEVNRITDAERRARLEKMTIPESLHRFDDLYQTWLLTGARAGGDLDAVARLRQEHHHTVRRAFQTYYLKTQIR